MVRRAGEVWSNLQLGLRLGSKSRALVTTTSRPIPIIGELMRQARYGSVAIDLRQSAEPGAAVHQSKGLRFALLPRRRHQRLAPLSRFRNSVAAAGTDTVAKGKVDARGSSSAAGRVAEPRSRLSHPSWHRLRAATRSSRLFRRFSWPIEFEIYADAQDVAFIVHLAVHSAGVG